METLQIALEPGGACGLAAVLFGKVPVAGKTIIVHATGGNLSWDKYCKIVNVDHSLMEKRVFDWTGFKIQETEGLKRPLLVIKGKRIIRIEFHS